MSGRQQTLLECIHKTTADIARFQSTSFSTVYHHTFSDKTLRLDASWLSVYVRSSHIHTRQSPDIAKLQSTSFSTGYHHTFSDKTPSLATIVQFVYLHCSQRHTGQSPTLPDSFHITQYSVSYI